MSFTSLFRHTEKATVEQGAGALWALIDIQSGLVRGSLVLLNPGKPSRILYTTQHQLPHKTIASSAYITKMMLKGVSEVAAELSKKGFISADVGGTVDSSGQQFGYHGNLAGVHYILSSPWVISQTKTVKIAYDKPTVITQATVQGVIDRARAELEAGEFNFDAISIEQKIFEVKLNGYSVGNYEGKTASNLEVSCAISVSSNKILEKIATHAQRSLHTKRFRYHSALLLEYAGLRSVLRDHQEYMVIHAHSELTDVVVVRAGMCAFLSSFPFGIFTVLRKIARTTRQTVSIADSTLALYDHSNESSGSIPKSLSREEQIRLEPVISAIGKGWIHDLHAALAHAGERMVIPRLIVLSAHSHLSFFKSELEKSAPVGSAPAISALELPVIEPFVQYDPGQVRSLRMGIYTTAIANLEN
ncbi:MAG: hypothetical protein RIT04_252 [Candidatus Parcubacteria bacterium]|jgi:hypothetical protein